MKQQKRRKPKQLVLNIRTWGGKRRGAGRPNNSKTVNHMKRPKVTKNYPCHITLRLKNDLPNLQNKRLYSEFKHAVAKAKEHGLRVIHYSLLRNHLHLIVEADSNRRLELGMRSLTGRFGKMIRKQAYFGGGDKAGRVFNGRYHLHVLKTPREMKNALEYVLLNESKHQNLIEHIRPYSSAGNFKMWRKLLGPKYNNVMHIQIRNLKHNSSESYLCVPQSWLCSTGWMRANGAASAKRQEVGG